MKKFTGAAALSVLALAALFAGGCGSDKEPAPETEIQTEEKKVITGYLISDADQYVKLGELKGLSVAHPVYEISDGEVDYEIQNMLYDYAETVTVDRAADQGDILDLTVTALIDGESEPYYDGEELSYDLGYEEFSPEFDKQLTGKMAGDNVKFSVTYDDDIYYNEDWVGHTVDFDVTVNSVGEYTVPEYTEEFVKENLGYDSKEEFEADYRAQMEENYASEADQETLLNALNAAMEESTIEGYPDQLYDSISEEVKAGYESFAEQFGMTLDELYESFGFSEDDMEDEILESVNRRLFVSAVCNQEGLTLTEQEYSDYVVNLADLYQYESVDELTAEYGKSALVWEAYTNKAAGFILLGAEVYDAPTSAEDGMLEEDLYDEDEEFIEADDGSYYEEDFIYDEFDETEEE